MLPWVQPYFYHTVSYRDLLAWEGGGGYSCTTIVKASETIVIMVHVMHKEHMTIIIEITGSKEINGVNLDINASSTQQTADLDCKMFLGGGG